MGACRFLDLSGFVNVLARAFAKVVQTVFGAIMVIWVFVLTLLTKGGTAATGLDYQDTLNEYYQNSVKGYDVFTLISQDRLLINFSCPFFSCQPVHYASICYTFFILPRFFGDKLDHIICMASRFQKETDHLQQYPYQKEYQKKNGQEKFIRSRSCDIRM